MGKKVIIVGGVAGGASAAARLRRMDENMEIIKNWYIEKNLYNRVISSILEKYEGKYNIIELIELETPIASVIDDPLEIAFDFTELLVKYA